MNQNIKMILGSHHHVAYGASDEDFKNAYDLKLKPFITTLYKFSHISVVLHCSGVFLYWIERHHPEFFMLLEDMASRKQLEFLGGGFYEPLMPLIPLSDRIGQIEMLTTYLRKQFGKRPQGCWLPGLSWDQILVGALNTSGMSFTFLDENQFRLSGIEQLDAPCITEDSGKMITIFPISSRYHAGFAGEKASGVLDRIISENSENSDGIVTVFPEQFCKDEYNSAAVELAVQDFFEELSKRSDDITFCTPGKLLKSVSSLKKIFVPNSSDSRFMYWAMDAESRKKHALPESGSLPSSASYPGSMIKQFLVQYPEANGIYSKMMHTSVLINQLRGDKSRKLTAREELWKAQGYDAFCYIGCGGIYKNTIRKAVYKSLLEAEKITREKRDFYPSLAVFDFDLDGELEYIFQNKDINAYVKNLGAAIFELDYLPKAWNYLDTFSRITEDGYQRSAFMDRLIPGHITFNDALKADFGKNRFCGLEQYSVLDMDRPHQKAGFMLPKNPKLPYGNIEIEKQYQLKKDSVSVSYALTNQGEEESSFQFTSQIDLSFAGVSEKFLRMFALGDKEKVPVSADTGNVEHVPGIEFQDIKNEVVINILNDNPSDMWILPIRTQCRINGEDIEEYQSTCIMPVKLLSLKAGECYKTVFTLKFYH